MRICHSVASSNKACEHSAEAVYHTLQFIHIVNIKIRTYICTYICGIIGEACLSGIKRRVSILKRGLVRSEIQMSKVSKYAKKKGYKIDEAMTKEAKMIMRLSKKVPVTIRLPKEVVDAYKKMAEDGSYQALMREILIENASS